MTVRCFFLSILCAISASAQFTPMFLQNGSYWGDGKSEVDFYDAEFIRDGQPRKCELMMIFTPKFVDPTSFADVDPKQTGALAAIQMHAFATVPRGIVAEESSINALWRMDSMSLARLSFAGTDGLGQMIKTFLETRIEQTVAWKYSADTYRGKIDNQNIAAPKTAAIFSDELPLRVRMIDFSKNSGDFDIQLAGTFVSPQKESSAFKPAKLFWKIGEREIAVEIKQDSGSDHFVLDRDFPFLLREWRMADGSRLKMKNSIKVDYRNYLKNGDRERALKDPMLRHPD